MNSGFFLFTNPRVENNIYNILYWKEALKLLKQKKSLFLRILEYICILLFAAALFFTSWAWIVSIRSSAAAQAAAAEDAALSSGPAAPELALETPGVRPTPAPAVAEKGVSIPGFKVMNIKADTQTVDVDLYNPEENKDFYYLTFEIRVPTGTGDYESVYASGLVEAGNHIYSITMTHSFPAGEYENCILHVQPYRMSDRSPTNNADITFTLVAK